MKTVAVIGATGAVGSEIVRLLEKRSFPLRTLRCFASPNSLGQHVSFRGEKIPLEVLSKEALANVDLAFFAAGSSVSRKWIPECSARCIDSSSAFRMDEKVPLIIPEINRAVLQKQRLIASPNCSATVLLMPLAPLHRLFQVKRVVAATYQAASGAGARFLQHLYDETRAHLAGESFPSPLPFPYAFNLFPHNSPLRANGYVEEEIKMMEETRKILGDLSIALTATCVRVPVPRAHSIAANVEFKKPFQMEEVLAAIRSMPGLQLFEDRSQNRFPTPTDATGRDEVLCGRFRIDLSQPNTLEFWAVGDQLLKGAALNAVQIGELC
ncbi:MAG: aspartate-semialdehyde dehydrogenase [Verrucomicrobiota bacterium]|nr:aspartate-semialdehyde dehydrogenase [Verrucomicrobiota bacterium]